MKVAGLLVCGAGEVPRYLAATLDEFERLCDFVVVACNGEDAKRDALIDRYGFERYRDDREWGLYQPNIKTDLLRRIGEKNPDYVVALDADEVFDPAFDRAELERLASAGHLGYYFYIVNLWNDPGHYWKASGFWNIRFFRYSPGNGLEYARKNVHCGLAPPAAYSLGRYAPFHVKHFGLMAEADRRRKVERYKKYDPNASKVGIGAYYDALTSTGTGSPFVEAEMREKVRNEVAKMVGNDKTPSMSKLKVSEFVYVLITKKDGTKLPVREIRDRDLEGLEKQKKAKQIADFEIISRTPVNGDGNVEAPVKREAKEESAGEFSGEGDAALKKEEKPAKAKRTLKAKTPKRK